MVVFFRLMSQLILRLTLIRTFVGGSLRGAQHFLIARAVSGVGRCREGGFRYRLGRSNHPRIGLRLEFLGDELVSKWVITYLYMGYIGDNPFTDHLRTSWDIQVRLRVGGWYVLLLMVLKSGYCNRLRERPLLKGKPGLFVLVGFCHEYLEPQPGTESMNCWLVKLFRVLDWCNF